jgi:hypothetical protein
MSTLQELAVLYSKKQPKQVDQILQDAPILRVVPFEAASHGLWHNYEELTAVTGAGLVDMDEALPTMSADSEVKKLDLSIMGGQITCGEDKAKAFGGKERYFASRMPAILKKTGQDTEYALIYNNFRAWAILNDTATEQHLINAGGSSNTGYTILAVRFSPGECYGLYDPNGFGKGAILDMAPINNGALYDIGSGVLGYGLRAKSYIGMLLANKWTTAAIVNIDASNLPTQTEIDDVLDLVRADNSNTFLFMHPKCRSMGVRKYKQDAVEMVPGDKGINNLVETWNGVPIIASYNFLNGTEANVAVGS